MIKTILAGVMVFLAIATAHDKLIYVLSCPTTPVAIPPNPVSGIASELPTTRPEQNRANGAGTCFINRLTVVGRRAALSRQIAGPRARSASQGLL